MQRIICHTCKSVLSPGSTYCPQCGSRITAADYVNDDTMQLNEIYLMPGTVLRSQYRVNSVIGQGGFGITYDGTDLKLDMHVAIKEYFPNPMATRQSTISNEVTCGANTAGLYEQGLKNFLKEARNMAKFAGEDNFVSVHDYFSENNTAYIIMEFVEGQNLKQYMQQHGRLTIEETMAIITPVMNTLEKIHSRNMIHRDVSPSNIMILQDARVRLLDFGAARDLSLEAGNLTTMSAVYKYGYSPIEQQTRDLPQGPYSDIYALCATMYEMLTGKTPPSPFNRLSGNEELIPPSRLGVRILPVQEEALIRGLSIYGKDRMQTIGELRAGLCGYQAGGTAGYQAGGTAGYQGAGTAGYQGAGTAGYQAGGSAGYRETAGGSGYGGSRQNEGLEYVGLNVPKLVLTVAACVLALILGGMVFYNVIAGRKGDGKTPVAAGSVPAQEQVTEAEDGADAQDAQAGDGAAVQGGQPEEDAAAQDQQAEDTAVQDQQAEDTAAQDQQAEAEPQSSDADAGALTPGWDSDSSQEEDAQNTEQEETYYDFPDGVLSFNGHHYYIYDDVTTWEGVLSKCEERNAYPAVVNDAEENEALYRYMISRGFDEAYFGLEDPDGTGAWQYPYGDSSDFRDWGCNVEGVREPNNADGNEDRAQFDIHMENGYWNDARFGKVIYAPDGDRYKDQYAYICEWGF